MGAKAQRKDVREILERDPGVVDQNEDGADVGEVIHLWRGSNPAENLLLWNKKPAWIGHSPEEGMMSKDTSKKTGRLRYLLALSSACLLLAGCTGDDAAPTLPSEGALNATATQPVVDITSPQDEVAVPGAAVDPTGTAVGVEGEEE